ncbi:MAG: hypothetical protein EOP09_12240, partial [Proteobacteria bacterium]
MKEKNEAAEAHLAIPRPRVMWGYGARLAHAGTLALGELMKSSMWNIRFRILSRLLTLLLALPALMLIFLSQAVASDDGPSSVRVVIPPRLAISLGQDALGKPSSLPEHSFVTIPVKKPIEATLRNINLKSAPEIVRIYGNRLFGFNFEKPFDADLKIFDLVNQGDVRIAKLEFTPGKTARHLIITAHIEMRRVHVKTREIWIRENGLSPDVKAPVSEGCPVAKNPIDGFRKDRLGARVLGATVLPKSAREAMIPVLASGKFEAEIQDDAKLGRHLILKPLEIRHAVPDVLLEHYQLIGKLEVPPVYVKIDGECFAGDTRPVEALFNSMRDEIKKKVVLGVRETLINVAMKASAQAFSELRLPVAGTYSLENESEKLASDAETQMFPDATAHRIPLRPFLLGEPQSGPPISVEEKVSEKVSDNGSPQ